MYLIVIISEQGTPYLHATPFTTRDAAASAACELSRDYPCALVRLFRLGEKLALAHYRKGVVLDASSAPSPTV